jgi:hypothetical protein
MSNLIKPQKFDLASINDAKLPENTFYGDKIDSSVQLSKKELEFIDAINYLPVSKIDRSNLIDLTFVIISNNLRAISSKMKAEDQVLMVNDFTNELITYFPQLTIKEFEFVITSGIRHKFDTEDNKTIGLSIVNFNLWVSIYLEQKAKMNLELSIKLKQSKFELPFTPAPVLSKDVINLIKSNFIELEKQYNSRSSLAKSNYTISDHFINYGLSISFNYVYSQLIKFELISDQLINSELELIRNGFLTAKKDPAYIKDEFKTIGTTKNNTIEDSARRVVCCKFYLKLINQL